MPEEQESDEEEGLERSEGGEGVEGKDAAQAAPPAANALLGLLSGGAVGKLQSKTVDAGNAGIKSNATPAPGPDTKSFLKSLSPTPMTPLKNPDAQMSQQLIPHFPQGVMG